MCRFVLRQAAQLRFPLLAGVLVLLAACATPEPPEPEGVPAREQVLAVTADGRLIGFNAGQPRQLLSSRALSGLLPGDRLVGIDFRVAKGVLYGLGRSGQLYTLDPGTGQARALGQGPQPVVLRGEHFGFDFNPALDRIRVVSDAGQNLRYHPDSGQQVDADPSAQGVQADGALHYAPGDVQAGQAPRVQGAGYTYNSQNEKITTNFAIDAREGMLVVQGSREGATPFESPNLGVLRTVGPLGLGPLQDVSFDISDVRNTALAAVRTPGHTRTRLYRMDLQTGKASLVGTVGQGDALVGMAIEP